MAKVIGYAAQSENSPLVPFHFERREPQNEDVLLEILYCGICHSDLHMLKNDWKTTIYPVVPGHEIVGRVVKVGSKVKKFKEGDLAAIGCMVGSCQKCAGCKEGLEQYCDEGSTMTYNGIDRIYKTRTYGGHSTHIVCEEKFVLHIPSKFKEKDLAGVAPLLCAGITTYSPLHHWNIGKGKKVGVVGLGGLGHMAVKIAKAMGAEVFVFTTSTKKLNIAKEYGAKESILSTDKKEMEKLANRLDFILDTVAAPHALDDYLKLLKRDGTHCLLGLPATPNPPEEVKNLILRRRQIAGSLIGGIQETQEMLDFCAENEITARVKVIPMQEVNDAYDALLKGEASYRFVIDLSSLRSQL